MKRSIRKALIQYPCGQGQHERFLLRNEEDLRNYAGYCGAHSEDFISNLLRSQLPVDRWSHIWDESPAGSALAVAMAKCEIEGGVPLVEYAKQFDARIARFASYISRGLSLVVNDAGGHFPIDDENMVIHEYQWLPVRVYSHTVNVGSTHIALENDPVMEPDADKELRRIDPKYSSVLELRKYDNAELLHVFKKFIAHGGHTVYVYTTGLDTGQMSKYIGVAFESGISNIVFNFNGGEAERLLRFARSECPSMNIQLSPDCAKDIAATPANQHA